MDLLYKLTAFVMVVSTVTITLRKYQPEISLSLSVLSGIFVLFLGWNALSSAIGLFSQVADKAGVLPELLKPLIKVLSVAVVSKLSVDVCKESGCLGLSTGIELIGNAVAIVTAAPLILSMLSFLTSI